MIWLALNILVVGIHCLCSFPLPILSLTYNLHTISHFRGRLALIHVNSWETQSMYSSTPTNLSTPGAAT